MADQTSPDILTAEVAWPFGISEISAAMRRYLAVPDLMVTDVEPIPLPDSHPRVNILHGIRVTVTSERDLDIASTYDLMLKEPQGATRKGLAGVARREAGFYRFLQSEVPLSTPNVVSAHPLGQWLIFEMPTAEFSPEKWQAKDFRQAVINIAAMHDRFWRLGSDLMMFPWLGRPLGPDFEVHLQAAASAFKHLVQDRHLVGLSNSQARLDALSSMVSQASKISARLRDAPETLIHGHYWPGVIGIRRDGQPHLVCDWQRVSVGPGILDLARFVSESRWQLDNQLPVEAEVLTHLYREQIATHTGHNWTDLEWQALWDSALIWVFLEDWLELLVVIPDALWDIRRGLIERVWFAPLLAAVHRQLNPETPAHLPVDEQAGEDNITEEAPQGDASSGVERDE